MMTHTIMLVPVSEQVGLTMVTFGLVDAIKSTGSEVHYFKPIAIDSNDATESVTTAKKLFNFSSPAPLLLKEVLNLLGNDRESEILEQVVDHYAQSGLLKAHHHSHGVTVIQGINYHAHYGVYSSYLNQMIARTFTAKVIFVATQKSDASYMLKENIGALEHIYRDKLHLEVLGYVVNGTDEEKIHELDQCRCHKTMISQIPTFAEFTQSYDQLHQSVTQYLSTDWISRITASSSCRFQTPPFFLHQLVSRAQQCKKRIVLPEAIDLRTLKAAIICHERKIANCVLLGCRYDIMRVCQENQLQLPEDIEIHESAEISHHYVEPMYQLRKEKGMTKEMAKELLMNNKIILGTMMLAVGDVDGMVSGALHTTPETVRPALQLIKTSKGHKIVSSSFFMCLPNEVVLYADCAVNRNPTEDDLAVIAIQSADTASLFEIEPQVGLLSFSTEKSGSGGDVDMIIKAVQQVKKMRPDLNVDGPLQYDAASDPVIAKRKAPDSKVAGSVNVYIFPNLNTGNIVYKAVQRTNQIICIGPILQGLKKPVNDLSRGASVEDIVYTIAVTAIQAEAIAKAKNHT